MPFEQIYNQRLLTFPPELRDSSIRYGELKRIIGRLVDELNDLGFQPENLRRIISGVESGEENPISDTVGNPERSEEQIFSYPESSAPVNAVPQQAAIYSRILYEVISNSGKSFPQLRVYMTTDNRSEARIRNLVPDTVRPDINAHGRDREPTSIPFAAPVSAQAAEREFVIPLVHDAKFFDLLQGNIQALTIQLEKIHSEFWESLQNLAGMIADTCQPASVAANYHPYSSVSTHPGTVEVKVRRMKGDLYAWREIFALFVESEMFEHTSRDRRVEREIEESETMLTLFADKVGRRKGRDGLKEKFKHTRSTEALQTFINLNFHILDIKKVFQANTEAIQKLVEKHTERTGLPISWSFSEHAHSLSIGHPHQPTCIPLPGLIHPRRFIQEISEKLFPIVPSQDDYSCAICMNIAFKPIRLSCTHLFCARCLVKMQRSREGNCPMCRAPSVLEANATNVDWALLNFMEDWFPREAGEKLKADEQEVVNEQLAEWRRNEAHCTIM